MVPSKESLKCGIFSYLYQIAFTDSTLDSLRCKKHKKQIIVCHISSFWGLFGPESFLRINVVWELIFVTENNSSLLEAPRLHLERARDRRAAQELLGALTIGGRSAWPGGGGGGVKEVR